MIKLNSVTIPTTKVREMCDFYVMALKAVCDESHGGPDRCEIKFDDDCIVICKTDVTPTVYPESCGMEFIVDDVDAEYKRLLAENIKIDPPVTYPWGWRAIGFKDPDGNNLDFVQYVGS